MCDRAPRTRQLVPARLHAFPHRRGLGSFMAQRIQTLLMDDLDGGEADEPSASAWTARNTRPASAPRTAMRCARHRGSTARTPGGRAARPGAWPAAGAPAPRSTPPRSASGPRGGASRSRTAAVSRPISSSSTRRPQGCRCLSGAPGHPYRRGERTLRNVSVRIVRQPAHTDTAWLRVADDTAALL